MMKLYKFRPLGNCQDLERASQILESGLFWCTRFWELNDPMEGVYVFNPHCMSELAREQFFGAKSRRVLCSFSGERALSNPLMWGYYANGFRGIAIEVDTPDHASNVKKVHYSTELPPIDEVVNNESVTRVLTTKLCCWSHEHEYRYIAEGTPGSLRVGQISAVYFGSPYSGIGNASDQPTHREYRCRVDSLKDTAKRSKIPCHEIRVEAGHAKVVLTSAQDAGTP